MFFLLALCILFFFFFFFSSRRRHTRSLCDWSSDVCSSDLVGRRDHRPARHAPCARARACRRAERAHPGDDLRRLPDVMGYSTVNVDELDAVWGVVRFARRALGVEAFGINWFELPPGGEGKEHDETASGQEEVSVVIDGSG